MAGEKKRPYAMALIVTPGQLSRRADFYHQLGQLTGAGISLLPTLEHLQKKPPGASYRVPLRRLVEELNHGFTFSEALRRIGGWLPMFDIAVLQAGEQSGRLENCFQLLADYYTDRARMARQIISDLLYPVFLLHFAVFIFALVSYFKSSNGYIFLIQTVGVLAPIYLFVALVIYVMQSRHGESWRSWVEHFLRPIP